MNRLNRRSEILNEIVAERIRQDKKWGEQNHPIVRMPNDHVSNISILYAYWHRAERARTFCDSEFANDRGDWGMILVEEVTEALAEGAAGNMEKCKAELIQVAAVAVAMIECIERGKVPSAKEGK